MTLVQEKKKEIIEQFKNHERDTGSPQVQIALLSERIRYLTEHFKCTNETITLAEAFLNWSDSGEDFSTI